MTASLDSHRAERAAKANHDNVRSCLIEIAGQIDGADGLTRLALADLVAWREIAIATEALPGTDSVWLRDLLDHARSEGLVDLSSRIGQGMAETPLEAAFRELETEDAAAARGGLEQSMLATMSQGESRPRSDPALAELPRQVLGSCSGEICARIIGLILEGLVRKPLLRHLNIVLLIEEARLDIAGGSMKADIRRKTAMDHALTRLLEAISGLPDMEMDGITTIFRAIGNMSRLNRSVSDGLDRVQDHAARAAKDEDLAEAARYSGRPPVSSYSDIRAAACQCRMFRDREKA